MKFIRSIMLTVLITLSVFSAVVYTACNKNKCDSVTCKNRGACDGGYCFCLTGFEGPRCATFSRDKFLYTFSGADSCTRNPKTPKPLIYISDNRINKSLFRGER